jgi:hypothetical protein
MSANVLLGTSYVIRCRPHVAAGKLLLLVVPQPGEQHDDERSLETPDHTAVRQDAFLTFGLPRRPRDVLQPISDTGIAADRLEVQGPLQLPAELRDDNLFEYFGIDMQQKLHALSGPEFTRQIVRSQDEYITRFRNHSPKCPFQLTAPAHQKLKGVVVSAARLGYEKTVRTGHVDEIQGYAP